MRDIKAKSTLRSRGAVAILAGMAYMLSGCVGDEDTSAGNPAAMTINTPAQIAQVSADDYNSNVNGLITGATLQHWIDDWENNKPAGINGRLIILQMTPKEVNKFKRDALGNVIVDENKKEVEVDYREYITPKPMDGVLSYRIDTSRQTQVRSNGVLETRQMVPDGNQMDALLADYNIDPRNDMIVCAMGTGTAGTTMAQGRCWYMFRYWGTPKENLAVLNGMAAHPQVMDQSYLSDVVTCDEVLDDSCLPRNGRVSVSDLPEDNTSLQATLEDVIAVVEGRENAFIWDARGSSEYMAASNGFRNSAPKQGHPNGAVLLPYSDLQITNDAVVLAEEGADGVVQSQSSLRYKDKTKLQQYMAGSVVDGAQFKRYDAGSLVPLGTGNAYQNGQTVITYCETTFRAMITGFASAAILGLPNRFYDGAMVEWNSLAAGVQDKYGSFILPADSPWRTDLDSRSHFVYQDDNTKIDPRTIDDAYAEHSNGIVNADRAYRLGASDTNSGGGSVAPPTNPCGG